jgi:hypothetical protein
MENRRRYKRITKSFMTWLRFRQAKAPVYPRGWDIVTTHDLGAGGILFNYDQRIEIGARIEFRIVLPSAQRQLKCIGEVVRNEKINSYKYSQIYRVAAEFKIIDTNSREIISALVDSMLCA